MICEPCKTSDHDHCEDFDPVQAGKRKPKRKLKAGRLYRSCNCQHAVRVSAEPATGPAGD